MIRLLPQRPPLSRARLTDLADQFRTGDLLLFSGRSLPSDTIRLFTRSHWSHVALVVCLPEYDEPLVLEATAAGEGLDVRTGARMPGVALVPLRDKIESYCGDVAWRQRRGAPLSEARQRMVARLVRELSHRPYKNYVLTLARDLCTGFQLRPDFSGVFCSELVAEIYRRLGWLPRRERPSRFVPGHFGSAQLTLVDGEMGPPVLLRELETGLASGWEDAAIASALPCRDRPAMPGRTGGHETLPLLQ